jgi:hypothetical protein
VSRTAAGFGRTFTGCEKCRLEIARGKKQQLAADRHLFLLCLPTVHANPRTCRHKFLGLQITQCDGTEWLGREGSNLRMPESKSGALPLGDAPAGRPRINQPGRPANPAKWPEGRHFCPVAGGGGHSYKGASRGEGPSFRNWYRRVAQPGRALRSGRRGRRFESSLSDHIFKHLSLHTF